METNFDVLIIGGGLAGLTAGIHLSQKKLKVVLVEKSSFPRHKVCGEYISNEILPNLKWLGVNVLELQPTNISKFKFTTQKGKTAEAKLPLGGFGISRYALDEFLYQKALANNCFVLKENVTNVSFTDDIFNITTSEQIITAKIVLGAFGKRSNIDQILDRNFFHKKSPWLAVKAHYSGNFDDTLVALHNFDGGYCGVSKVESNVINICYITDYATFKKYKNIEEYQQNILYKNQHLKFIFENSTLLFEKPLTISQISFNEKKAVENHVIMIGDTAGLIHPLCGNGMAMAMHSAKIASEILLKYFSDKEMNRDLLEKKYTNEWKKHFGKRIVMGRILARILTYKSITTLFVAIIASFPGLFRTIIKQTHGKPIIIK